MDAGQEFLDLMKLQAEPIMITKSELIEQVRESGARISDRLLTYYATEGLIPKSVRIGSRSGAYPAVVRDLLVWVVRSRDDRGMSVESIRELVPVWKFLRRAAVEGSLEISAFEDVARANLSLPEAMFNLPGTAYAALMSFCCTECVGTIKINFKDGSHKTVEEHPYLSFAIKVDAANTADPDDEDTYFRTQIALPVASLTDEQSIGSVVLELPDVEARPPSNSVTRRASHEHEAEAAEGGEATQGKG